jgi:hypothetical protein
MVSISSLGKLALELYVGIVSLFPIPSYFSPTMQICGSLPTTKQFFNRYVPKFMGSSILSHVKAPTRLSFFLGSNWRSQRSLPLDNDYELGIHSPNIHRQPNIALKSRWQTGHQIILQWSLLSKSMMREL